MEYFLRDFKIKQEVFEGRGKRGIWGTTTPEQTRLKTRNHNLRAKEAA